MVTKFNLMKKMNNTNTKNKIIYNYKIATKEGHSKWKWQCKKKECEKKYNAVLVEMKPLHSTM